ncbi:MAG: hypothetical protein ABJG15_12575 [Hyphomonadaceae bacterium]
MSDDVPTVGVGLKAPHVSLLKRIDVGLMTGILALVLSFVGIITALATYQLEERTQKALVLPIVDIDLGYLSKIDPATDTTRSYFEVSLNNVGAGLAHIQSVTPRIKGEPATDYEAFDLSIMTGRMRSWATLTDAPATGFVRAGEHVTPLSYRIGGSSGDLQAYLNGQWGTPMEGVDVDVCYCSVFDDCWTVSFLDRKQPKPVRSCGISDQTVDGFQDFIDQRTAARQSSE